jgi:hypothetical protein
MFVPFLMVKNNCSGDGNGRHKGLKTPGPKGREGSIPSPSTNADMAEWQTLQA